MKSVKLKGRALVQSVLAAGAETSKPRRPPAFEHKQRVRGAKPSRLIAYDFETTRIAVGTPRPLYLTAFSEREKFQFATPIRDMEHLGQIIEREFLTDEFVGARFVAWNANNFDAYFVAVALLQCPQYVVRPYLTRSSSVRGIRVIARADIDNPNPRSWEFLDGIAMLGLAGFKLEKFLKTFAPDHAKMVGVIDFESEEFDATNPRHCEYAMRDSVGLYYGMVRAERIMLDTFNQPLGVTMGGACIKIFQAHIPANVSIATPRDEVINLTREYTMRGGYCFCVRRYHGPIWKYDLNQAYASAMRDADLPCGFTAEHWRLPAEGVYVAHIRAWNPRNRVPFYYRTEDANGRLRSVFGTTEIRDTWLTSLEVRQLQSEGWRIECDHAFSWADSFRMKDYVDKLERLRLTCDGGPSGAIGTMVKATGNHSFGKLAEVLEPVEYVIAAECPAGFVNYYPDGLSDPLPFVFMRFVDDQKPKAYHQPQVSAVITAHVRMLVRRAALLAPDAWIYADTDCVVFTRDVTAQLDIDPGRYGAWKIEEEGTIYRVIAKKVYASEDGSKRSAKGLHVRKLTNEQFAEWYEGRPPLQEQVQRNNFLSVMEGAEMYRRQLRSGTRVESTI